MFRKPDNPLVRKEKFRYKMQRFLSRKYVVIPFCTLLGAFWFLLANVALQLVTSFATDFLGKGITPTLQGINPFHFVTNGSWGWFYLIAAAIAVVMSVRIGFRMILAYEPLADEATKGDRRWATLDELKAQYAKVPAVEPNADCTGDIDGPGGFPITRYTSGFKDYFLIDRDPANNLCIGTSRSGKGELYVKPIIDLYSRAKEIADKASLVIADPKGELAAATRDALVRRGYEVHIFNLKPPFDGLSYNPLERVKNAYIAFLDYQKQAGAAKTPEEQNALLGKAEAESAKAESYAKSLAYVINFDANAKEKIWQEWGTAITTSVIMAVTVDCCEQAQKCLAEGNQEEAETWYSRITMYSVARYITDYCKPDPENGDIPPLDSYVMSKSWAARYQYSPVNAADNKTKGNITAEAMAKLSQLMLTPIAKLTAKNDLDMEKIGFGEKPIALFMVTPDYDPSNDFLLTIFLTQIYQALSYRADMEGKRCTRQVIYLLDEFGNIPPIPNMAHFLTVCLGRNIRFDMFVQAYAQLKALYKDDESIIRGNCGNHVYILSNDTETNKAFSEEIGYETVTVNSRYGNPLALDKNITEQTDRHPLLDANQLPDLAMGETVVVRALHRSDLKNRDIRKKYPILNTGEMRLKPCYEYLHSFSDEPFTALNLSATCTHLTVNLENIVFDPITQQGWQPPKAQDDSEEPDEDGVLEDDVGPSGDEILADFVPAEKLQVITNRLNMVDDSLLSDKELGDCSWSEFASLLQMSDSVPDALFDDLIGQVEQCWKEGVPKQ